MVGSHGQPYSVVQHGVVQLTKCSEQQDEGEVESGKCSKNKD